MGWRSGLEDYLAGCPPGVPADPFVWHVQAPEQEPNMELYHHTSETTSLAGLYLTGRFGGLNPPRKFLTPPAAIKKRKGVDFLRTYALARSLTSIAKTSTPPNEI